MLWCQTPSRKKRVVVFTAVTTSAHQDQLKTKRFSKVCEIFKVCGTESLNTSESFTHRSVIVTDISTPRNVTLNETNCDWLFEMSVKWPHGRALANESCHVFQTFSHQSEGLARLDYQAGRGGKSTKIFYSSKSTITLLKFYLSTSKSTSLKIYSSKSKK